MRCCSNRFCLCRSGNPADDQACICCITAEIINTIQFELNAATAEQLPMLILEMGLKPKHAER